MLGIQEQYFFGKPSELLLSALKGPMQNNWHIIKRKDFIEGRWPQGPDGIFSF